jgi:hypothetical protein
MARHTQHARKKKIRVMRALFKRQTRSPSPLALTLALTLANNKTEIFALKLPRTGIAVRSW